MIDKLIGNTPMIKIKYRYDGRERNVYSKLEYYNYTGSIKDRIVLNIIKSAYKDKILVEGQPIVEVSSGNTGVSLAAIGALFRHPVHIFIPSSASSERINLMKLYGAFVHVLDLSYVDLLTEAEKFKNKINGFMPNQFTNLVNSFTHYDKTASEIIEKIKDIKIDGFVSGIGTGGTLMGIGEKLKTFDSSIKLMALEPDSMPLLSTGKKISNHKIEGIGDDFIPELVHKELIDEIISINDIDAMMMSRKLASTFGLGVGISSGANFLAAVKSNKNNIVTVFPDDSKKYLSTDLLDFNIINASSIVNNIDLISIEVI